MKPVFLVCLAFSFSHVRTSTDCAIYLAT